MPMSLKTVQLIVGRSVTHREFVDSLAGTLRVGRPKLPPKWITPLWPAVLAGLDEAPLPTRRSRLKLVAQKYVKPRPSFDKDRTINPRRLRNLETLNPSIARILHLPKRAVAAIVFRR
jgi:hypothetical protein